jgi:hypothetical protein
MPLDFPASGRRVIGRAWWACTKQIQLEYRAAQLRFGQRQVECQEGLRDVRKIARGRSGKRKAEKVAAGTVEWGDPILHGKVGCVSR